MSEYQCSTLNVRIRAQDMEPLALTNNHTTRQLAQMAQKTAGPTATATTPSKATATCAPGWLTAGAQFQKHRVCGFERNEVRESDEGEEPARQPSGRSRDATLFSPPAGAPKRFPFIPLPHPSLPSTLHLVVSFVEYSQKECPSQCMLAN